VGSWFGIQLFLVFADRTGMVAYTAHIGGFLTGMAIAQLIRVERAPKRGEEHTVDELDALATTPELRNALEMMRGEEHDDIRRAWMDYFADRATCPRCGSRMKLGGNMIRCECGFKAGTGWHRTR